MSPATALPELSVTNSEPLMLPTPLYVSSTVDSTGVVVVDSADSGSTTTGVWSVVAPGQMTASARPGATSTPTSRASNSRTARAMWAAGLERSVVCDTTSPFSGQG